MLTITIPELEFYNEATDEFVVIKPQVLRLEHSLLSLSKWESKWKKPFLEKRGTKTIEESIDYIRCMTLTQNVDPFTYYGITQDIMDKVAAYIDDPMTATTISSKKEGRAPSKDIVTSELIYYWMVSLQIPFECQKWHLNRLMTLIQVCNIKNAPPKKMSKSEIMRQNAELNALRRKQMNSKG